MEKEPKPFSEEKADAIMGDESMAEEREMSERRVKDILNKTKTRALSDAELIQKGAKPVLDEGTENLRLEISKKALRGVKKEMSENLSPKDRPRILEVIKKLGIKGNRWISDEEYIRKEKERGHLSNLWEDLYRGDKYYEMGDVIRIKCKNGRVFKGRLIEEEDRKTYDINDHLVEAVFRLRDDHISVGGRYGTGAIDEDVLFNDIEDISIVKKEE